MINNKIPRRKDEILFELSKTFFRVQSLNRFVKLNSTFIFIYAVRQTETDFF